MTKIYREGKLVLDGSGQRDSEALGNISGVDDLLRKIDRLEAEVQPAVGSLRAQYIAAIREHARHVRRTLDSNPSTEVSSALFHLMHASMSYVALLSELASDVPAGARSDLTRAEYLEFRAKAKSRTELADLCGFKGGVAALAKWEDRNDLPRPRQSGDDSNDGVLKPPQD